MFDGVNVLSVNIDNTTGYQTVRLKLLLKQPSNNILHGKMNFKHFALALSVMTPYIFVVVKTPE